MDAVLPLTRRDISRATILFRSLEKFFDGLGTVLVVVPKEAEPATQELRFPTRFKVDVRLELEMVPEFTDFPRVRGWYKQQLLKLAAHAHVSSPFYLTLDADVVATRPVSPDKLVRDGRAMSHVIPRDDHPDWYRQTARFLGKPLCRTGILHAVTPAVLSTDGVRHLATSMSKRFANAEWSKALPGLRQRWARFRGGRGWRTYLLAGLPWTEYALYYSFLELEGLYERYHLESEDCIYDVEGSLWKSDASSFADGWDPSALFTGHGPPYFAVLQSNMGIPPHKIAERLQPHIATSHQNGS